MALNAFVPDREDERATYILRGHLPPVADYVARSYIQAFTAPGDLVLDPFAHSPTVARAAYELGRRVIAVESNPLAAFVTRVQANPPAPHLIDDGVKAVGETTKDELLLRDHLDGLYATTCAACGERVIADAFVYSSELSAPVEKIYTCVQDGARHDATTDAERTQFAAFEKRGFHYHYVWNRISDALGGDPHAQNLREALTYYTPRTLYALVTLWLKFDAVLENHPAREALGACFIHALDRGALVYSPHDEFPARKMPALALEPNIWRVFTDAARGLKNQTPLRLVENVDTLVAFREPGAFVARGSTRQLAADEKLDAQVALLLTNPPQLDPIFWTLSFLWARWVWGRKAREAEALEPFLNSERHRWSWYGDALMNALQAATQFLKPGARAVFTFPSGNHALVEALTIGASASGLALATYLFRPHAGARETSEFGALRGDYRVVFQAAPTKTSEAMGASILGKRVRDEALDAAQEILNERAEPLPFAWLFHRALAQVTQGGFAAQVAQTKFPRNDNAYQFLHRELTNGIKAGYVDNFDHWKDNARVLWFQRESDAGGLALAERVEDTVRELFARVGEISAPAFEDAVLNALSGWSTPEPELVSAAASAYADLRDDTWFARADDFESAREHALDILARLSEKLGFEAATNPAPFDAQWWESKMIPASSAGSVTETRVREPSHVFVFARRAAFREFVARRVAPLQGIVMVREQQLALVREMVWRLPTLTKKFYDEGWNFLRVKIAEDALAHEGLERRHWRALLGLEPAFEKGKEQLELF